jgi:hypothetical protein
MNARMEPNTESMNPTPDSNRTHEQACKHDRRANSRNEPEKRLHASRKVGARGANPRKRTQITHACMEDVVRFETRSLATGAELQRDWQVASTIWIDRGASVPSAPNLLDGLTGPARRVHGIGGFTGMPAAPGRAGST